MVGRLRPLALLGWLGLLSFTAAVSVAQADPVIFAGSGTNLAITQLLVKEYTRLHPDVTIDVPKSIGSGAGIQAAADGAITVGLISRPMKGEAILRANGYLPGK